MIWKNTIDRMKHIEDILPELYRRKRWKSGYEISGLVSGLEEVVEEAGETFISVHKGIFVLEYAL